MRGMFTLKLAALSTALLSVPGLAAAAAEADPPFTVVVMDPLSLPLACDCVEGYAQRKYEKLGEYLEAELGRPVRVVWSEALTTALEGEAEGRADLVIGKHSVVLSDAKDASVEVTPVAALTGKDGKTTQTGLIVVPNLSEAKTVADLKGYRIIFGPADCDEKSAAPMALLKDAGVPLPKVIETAPACSTAATMVMEVAGQEKAAAVISSYAQPLLEGCGTIKKGDLRIVGESKPVPFITAFVTDRVSPADRERITEALLAAGEDAALLEALETKSGFVKPTEDVTTAEAKKK